MNLQAYEVSPPQSEHEAERLALLAELGATDSATAALLHGFAEVAAAIARCPLAWISFVTADHDLAVCAIGTRGRAVPRVASFGGELVDAATPLAVQRPAQFVPIEPEATIAYCAGFPLLTDEGHALGGVCVADFSTRTLDLDQQSALAVTARLIIQTLESNRNLVRARAALDERRSEIEHFAQAVGKLQDVTIAKDVRAAELAERNAELQNMAETDGLTGLRNYRSLNEHLRHAFGADEPIAVMLIDIDWFKNFNDAFGHVAGDETLRTVGQLIAMEATEGIIAARYGGEEFALVVPTNDSKVVLHIGERLRQRIERHPWTNRQITVCAGAAVRTADVATVEDLVRRADDALYAAKRTGKNRVLAWAPR